MRALYVFLIAHTFIRAMHSEYYTHALHFGCFFFLSLFFSVVFLSLFFLETIQCFGRLLIDTQRYTYTSCARDLLRTGV